MSKGLILSTFAALLVVIVLTTMTVLARSSSFPANLVFPLLAATFLGVLTPMAIIALRHQVRIARIRLIGLFAKTFALNDKDNVSFEFVRGKYFVDLADSEETDALPRFPF